MTETMTATERAQEFYKWLTILPREMTNTEKSASEIIRSLLTEHSMMLEALERMQLIEGSTQAYIMKQIAREAVEKVRGK